MSHEVEQQPDLCIHEVSDVDGEPPSCFASKMRLAEAVPRFIYCVGCVGDSIQHLVRVVHHRSF